MVKCIQKAGDEMLNKNLINKNLIGCFKVGDRVQTTDKRLIDGIVSHVYHGDEECPLPIVVTWACGFRPLPHDASQLQLVD